MSADVLQRAISGKPIKGAGMALARGSVVTSAVPQNPNSSPPQRAATSAIGVLPEETAQPAPETAQQPQTPRQTGAQMLAALVQEDTARKADQKSMASMAAAKTLTRLLGAIYHKPGALASDQEKRDALAQLSADSRALALQYLAQMGKEQSDYSVAMAMDACVNLTCTGWESGVQYDWERILQEAVSDPRLVDASNTLSQAVYVKAKSEESARERLSISLHTAFWKLYQSGEKINGMDAASAANSIESMAAFLNDFLVSQNSFLSSVDLSVAWMQGSIGRLSDLLLAELHARQARDPEWRLSPQDLNDALALARDGFRSVEKFAQALLGMPPAPAQSTADVPA